MVMTLEEIEGLTIEEIKYLKDNGIVMDIINMINLYYKGYTEHKLKSFELYIYDNNHISKTIFKCFRHFDVSICNKIKNKTEILIYHLKKEEFISQFVDKYINEIKNLANTKNNGNVDNSEDDIYYNNIHHQKDKYILEIFSEKEIKTLLPLCFQYDCYEGEIKPFNLSKTKEFTSKDKSFLSWIFGL